MTEANYVYTERDIPLLSRIRLIGHGLAALSFTASFALLGVGAYEFSQGNTSEGIELALASPPLAALGLTSGLTARGAEEILASMNNSEA